MILLLTKAVATILDDICASAHSTTVGDRFLYHAIILSPLTIRPLPVIGSGRIVSDLAIRWHGHSCPCIRESWQSPNCKIHSSDTDFALTTYFVTTTELLSVRFVHFYPPPLPKRSRNWLKFSTLPLRAPRGHPSTGLRYGGLGARWRRSQSWRSVAQMSESGKSGWRTKIWDAPAREAQFRLLRKRFAPFCDYAIIHHGSASCIFYQVMSYQALLWEKTLSSS